MIRNSWLLMAIAGLACGADTARQPAYPIFGIFQRDPAFAERQVVAEGVDFAQIGSARLIYSGEAGLSAIRDARKSPGGGPAVIVYMGGFTTNPGGATAVESGYRRATAMIDVTTLTAPVDQNSAEVRVAIPADHELAIRASTADLSDPHDHAKFCFWIRIDDELMQVKAVDPLTGALTVKRAFESKAGPHAAGAKVFTPVYVGNRNDLGALRHSNSWPGGPDYLRYALDPRSPAAQDYKAGIIIQLMKAGYDGAWLDTFQGYRLYNLCDALGRPVRNYYDFNTERRYDTASYYTALQDYIRAVRMRVRKATGRKPVLVANNVAGSYEFGGKSLFRTADNPDLLDGYCFEDSYIGIAGREGKRGGTVRMRAVGAERWTRNLTNQSDAAKAGLASYNMIAMAGYVAAYLNPQMPDYDRLIRFGYASFLLTVTRERTTLFGLPLIFTQRNGHGALLPWPEIVFAPIGDPVDGVFDVDHKTKGGYYERRFTRGIVYVNPPGAKDVEVAAPAGYVHWQSGQPVRILYLGPGDAALLLRTAK